MSAFKDLIKNDIDSVFLNSDEFAEPHKIDNRVLNVVVDNDKLIERSKKEFDGISVGEILYFVNALDFGELPEEGRTQMFDGRMMYVFSAREDEGMYEIILRQNRGE